MRRHLLGDLEPAAILEVGGDAGRPEGVATDLGLDPGRKRPPANHPPDIGLEQGIAGQLARSPARRAEERSFPVLGDAGRLDVLVEVAVQIVVGRHRVLLAALLMQPDPAAAPLHKVVLDPHRNRGADAGKGVDHQADQRPIAQAGQGIGVDRIEQCPRLVGPRAPASCPAAACASARAPRGRD